MPREQINQPVGIYSDGAAIHVGWNKAYPHVQVGLEVDIDYADFATRSSYAPGRIMLWSPCLTAADIDKTIRTLRKAKRALRGRQ